MKSSLKRFLVNECILVIDFFCESLWNQDQKYVSSSHFLIAMHEKDTATEVYLEPFKHMC